MELEQTPSNCSCSSSVLLNMTSLYMDRVSLPTVGVVGLAGNIAAIVIICRKDKRSTFHHSLITLALIDILFVREGFQISKEFPQYPHRVWGTSP